MTFAQIQITALLILSAVFGTCAVLGQRVMPALSKKQSKEPNIFKSVAWV